jgi:hypothetical protein
VSFGRFHRKGREGRKGKGELFLRPLLASGEEILPKPAKALPLKRKIHGIDSDPSLRFGISKKR